MQLLLLSQACDELNVKPDQCLIIGDRVETDIAGGKNARLGATVWINFDSSYQTLPNENNYPDFTLHNVMELKNVLEELTAKKRQFSWQITNKIFVHYRTSFNYYYFFLEIILWYYGAIFKNWFFIIISH